MRISFSLPLIEGQLGPEVAVPVRVPSMGQLEIFNHSLCLNLLTSRKQVTDVK